MCLCLDIPETGLLQCIVFLYISNVKEKWNLTAGQRNKVFSGIRLFNSQGGEFILPVLQILKEAFST